MYFLVAHILKTVHSYLFSISIHNSAIKNTSSTYSKQKQRIYPFILVQFHPLIHQITVIIVDVNSTPLQTV